MKADAARRIPTDYPDDFQGAVLQLCGEEAMASIRARWGGGRLYIPHNPGPQSPLAQQIGLTAARALAAVYGGDEVAVNLRPPPPEAAVIELSAKGWGPQQIARHLGHTRRHIQRLRKRLGIGQ